MQEDWPEDLPRPEDIPEKAIEIYKEYMLVSGHAVSGLWGITFSEDTDPEDLDGFAQRQAGEDLMDCLQSHIGHDKESPEHTSHSEDEPCPNVRQAPIVFVGNQGEGVAAVVRKAVTGVRCWYKVRDVDGEEEVRGVLEMRQKRATRDEFENLVEAHLKDDTTEAADNQS